MNLNDILLSDDHDVTVKCRETKRELTGAKDFNDERFFVVTEKGKRLVETEVIDEAVRFLVGEKG